MPRPPMQCRDPSAAVGEIVDRSLHAALARFTGGLSPASLTAAYMDWATHLAMSPGKQMQLAEKAMSKSMRLARHFASNATARPAFQLLRSNDLVW
ncbi:MAG: poly-beta-hydroxybutyrate polymerase N-terminal domain-containing protein [Hyphomicrobium sp.]